ncbi:MAG TPA: hypothetical protein VM889_03555 [Candidatus Thermoplasmatota archaeon]|nr:hypothetical protein [Candidatus Thermoplasmatota archaeon]
MRRLATLAVLLALAGAGLAGNAAPRAAFVATGAGELGVVFDRAETVAGVPGAGVDAVAEAYAAALRRALERPPGVSLDVSSLLGAEAVEVRVVASGANATLEARLVDRGTFATRAAAPAAHAHPATTFRFAVSPRDAASLAVVVVALGPDGVVLQSAAHALDDDRTTRQSARAVLVERIGPAACDGCGTVDLALLRLEGEHGLSAASADAAPRGYVGTVDAARLAAGLALGGALAAALVAFGRRAA